MTIKQLVEMLVGKRASDDTKRWRAYKARVNQLPENYRTAVEALERYLMYRGAITKGDVFMSMLNDLADLFEQSVANGTTIREIVGEDPVEFAEEFLQNYSEGQWINKERERLTDAINRAAGDKP
ncbi:MAG TPA: DUF1048 domain-containing protein [Actinopolymorphaceae bacterium]|jgi:DNA-binding ferritin-like protein (Dps family)